MRLLRVVRRYVHRPGPRREPVGVTLAGDRIAPASVGSDAAAPDGPHPETVEVEGAAPADPAGHGAPVAWLFRPEREPAAVALDDLPRLVTDEDNFVWVDLSDYAEADVREVGRLLGLHRRAVAAALSPWQAPRLVVYGDHFLVSATVARLDTAAYRIQAGELDLFVGANYLVSAHKRSLPFADHLRARAHSSPDLVALDAAFMLYLVLDEVLAYGEELERQLQAGIEQLEERALHDPSDVFLEELLRFKRYAFALSQLAEEHRPVFAAFLRPDFRWVAGEEVEEYFEDLDRRLTRLLAALAAARDAANGAFDIYVSHMAHRTNQVIKVLTMVSTVLLPATVVIALFGTSVAASLHGRWINTPAGLAVMLLCVLTVSGGTLWAFHRRGWV